LLHLKSNLQLFLLSIEASQIEIVKEPKNPNMQPTNEQIQVPEHSRWSSNLGKQQSKSLTKLSDIDNIDLSTI